MKIRLIIIIYLLFGLSVKGDQNLLLVLLIINFCTKVSMSCAAQFWFSIWVITKMNFPKEYNMQSVICSQRCFWAAKFSVSSVPHYTRKHLHHSNQINSMARTYSHLYK